jgi:DNA-binding CsgD family transcriptional regulator
VPALRWATTLVASRADGTQARAHAAALAHIAAATANREALSAVGHALGECALLDGEVDQATRHFSRALDLLGGLELPLERALTLLRSGQALAQLAERQAAVDRLAAAYHAARRLGARPLAQTAARELAALGEPSDRRLGRDAATWLAAGGLSRREVEVVRLVALGRTNAEIGRDLFLSTRTVDMHVRNILAKLGSRSRAEATRRAGELDLLASGQLRND